MKQHIELGRELNAVEKNVNKSIEKLNSITPKTDPALKRLFRISDMVGQIRARLDSRMWREYRDTRSFDVYYGPRGRSRGA
jgi:hypothetical protein